MHDDYQERLEYLYGRLNYEWLGMPRSPGQLKLGRMRRLLRRHGRSAPRAADHPRGGDQGKRLDRGDDRRGALRLGRADRAVLFAAPAPSGRAVHGRRQAGLAGELIALVDVVRDAVEQLEREDIAPVTAALTFFEITTAMGLLHFARRRSGRSCSRSAWAAGSTRPTSSGPLLSIITSISFDHTRQLGNTLAVDRHREGRDFRNAAGRASAASASAEASRRSAGWPRCGAAACARSTRDFGTTHPAGTSADAAHRRSGSPCGPGAADWGTTDAAAARPPPGPQCGRRPGGLRLSGRGRAAAGGQPRRRCPRLCGAEVAGAGRGGRPEPVPGDRRCATTSPRPIALADTLRTCFPPRGARWSSAPRATRTSAGQLQALLPCFDEIIATRYVENPRSVSPETIADQRR